MNVEFRPLSYALGAEVLGADLSRPPTTELIAQIQSAILEHKVLLLRNQVITPAQHVAFTERFGKQEPYAFDHQRHPEFPVINVVTNARESGFKPEAINRGTEWHTDLSFSTHPAELSLLYYLAIPEIGGSTIFANMSLAFERLSQAYQKLIDPLYGVHALFENAYTAQNRANEEETRSLIAKHPPIAHRLVLEHPLTGRKALYVAASKMKEIVGMTQEESASILQYLFRHAERIEFTYRHSWKKGDLLIWDNRAVQHQEVPDCAHRQLRLHHRTTIIGPRRGVLVPDNRVNWNPAPDDPLAAIQQPAVQAQP